MKKLTTIDHEDNSRFDGKLLKVIKKHGYEGFGIFWGIVEYLHQQDGFIDKNYEEISEILPYFSGEISTFFDTFFEVGLFKINGKNQIYSDRCLHEIRKQKKYISDKSKAGKKGMETRYLKDNTQNNNVINSDSNIDDNNGCNSDINDVDNNVDNNAYNKQDNSIYLSNYLSNLSNKEKEKINKKEKDFTKYPQIIFGLETEEQLS